LLAAPLQAEDFDPLPILKASEILPPELLKSDLHQVDEQVHNDGYVNTYTIQSDYGEFSAYGLSLLRILVQEIKALDELSRVKKSDLYADAAKNAVMAPVKAVGVFVSKPVETISGMPAGVGRMFRGFGRTAKGVTEGAKKDEQCEDDGEDEDPQVACVQDNQENETAMYAKKFMGVTGAQRAWAAKLSVDPYSSNQLLQEKLAEVASVDAAANFGAKLLMPGLGVVGMAATATNLVWSVSAEELRAQNLIKLQERGASEEQIEKFLDNEMYSPTVQTVVVIAMLEMEGVENVPVVLEKALAADSEQTAVFFANTIRMLAKFHTLEGGLASLTGTGPLVGGLTRDNRLVFAVPVGHLVWRRYSPKSWMAA